MKMSLKVVSLSLCLVLAGASAFACGAKASGESLGGGAVKAEKSGCASKSGEALGGGAEKADKAGCAAAMSACASKSGEALGGGADKAGCPVTGAKAISEALGGSADKAAGDKAGCAAAMSACASKTGEALGGSADKAAGDKAGCAAAMSACASKSGEALGGSGDVKSKAKDDCAAACAAKSGESLGGSAEKAAADKAACEAECAAKSAESLGGGADKMAAKAAGELKACCAGCEGKIAKGEKPECCVKAALGGGADSKDATGMKAKDEHAGHEHGKKDKDAMKAKKAGGEAMGGSAEAGAGAYKVGSQIADFTLAEAKSGSPAALSSLAGEKATALIFWNQECPFVVDVQNRVNEFHKAYSGKGVNVVAIDGGNNNSADAIKAHAQQFAFPIVMNPDTKVSSKFGATRTPEVFLLDSNMNVLYHGAFDSGTMQGADKPESNYVIDFVDNMLAGKANPVTQTKPFGCSLKYAKGVGPLK